MIENNFQSWQPIAEDWKPVEDPHEYWPFADHSINFSFHNDYNHYNLPKFGSMKLSSSSQHNTFTTQDALLNTGGPIWALDWCPSTINSSPQNSKTKTTSSQQITENFYLAVGSHPYSEEPHTIGQAILRKNCIQLWEIPGDLAHQAPRMKLAIGHGGGVTWHLQWCPSKSLATDTRTQNIDSHMMVDYHGTILPRLGLLCAALGDGSVCIWAVPQPSALHQHLVLRDNTQGHAAAAASSLSETYPHTTVDAVPIAKIASIHLNGSMPNRVDWLPDEPHDLLLIGCWDGSVALVKLMLSQGSSTESSMDATGRTRTTSRNTKESMNDAMLAHPVNMHVLLHFPAESQILRVVKWMPRGYGDNTIDSSNRYMFCTCGNEGMFKIWDARDPFRPSYSIPTGTQIIHDGLWLEDPLGFVFALDDSSVRGTLLDGSSIINFSTSKQKPIMLFTWRGSTVGAFWSMDNIEGTNIIAYSGEDGIVGMASMELTWFVKKRRNPHCPLGALKFVSEGDVMKVLNQEELQSYNNAGLYVDRVAERRESLVETVGEYAHALQSIHKVKWSRVVKSAGREEMAWLASGGAAGLLRCQLVKLPT